MFRLFSRQVAKVPGARAVANVAADATKLITTVNPEKWVAHYEDPENFHIPPTTYMVDVKALREEDNKWKRANEFDYPQQENTYNSSSFKASR